MSTLSYVTKEKMAQFFGIKHGYVFSFLNNGYNKTNTRNIILEATGIDIYADPDFDLSQERCIRKIWDEYDDYTVGKLLKVMLDYYESVADWDWNRNDEVIYAELRELETELLSKQVPVILPSGENDTIQLIKEDIERNCTNNTPELALDRLHTFATEFFRSICQKHGIDIEDNRGNKYPLHSLVGNLKNWYASNDYFESEFSIIAIQNVINIFTKYNDIRNDQSAAHPNALLNKAEAMFAIRIVTETLTFVDEIEQIKDSETAQNRSPWDDIDFDDLPF